MFIVKVFLGTPIPTGCALASLGHSQAHVKFEPAPPRGRNMVSDTVELGWVEIRQINSLVNGPKFIRFFGQTWEG